MSTEDVSHAWDEFVAYVTNNPESRFLTISAEMAKRLVAEHRWTCTICGGRVDLTGAVRPAT